MVAYIALAALLYSLVKLEQFEVRVWGILASTLYMVAYVDDFVILVTNIVIIAAHIRWLYIAGHTAKDVKGYLMGRWR